MGTINDSASIGGGGTAKIRDSILIGFKPPPPPLPLTITQYITSPNTSEAHTFSYPADQLVTCWDGAKLGIVDPLDGLAPFTWVSSNNAIAEVDADGVVTLHGSGSFTITVTDSTGRSGVITLAPAKFFLEQPGPATWTESNDAAEANGGTMPYIADVTLGEGVRGVGTLISEWGNLMDNGSGWQFANKNYWMWLSDPDESNPDWNWAVEGNGNPGANSPGTPLGGILTLLTDSTI